MFGTSAGTSKFRFWLFWKQIQNSWYSNFQQQLLFLWNDPILWPYWTLLFPKHLQKIINDFIWDLTNFKIEMLQLWYHFTWAIQKVGIKVRSVLESAWTELLRIGWLFISRFWKLGEKGERKRAKYQNYWFFWDTLCSARPQGPQNSDFDYCENEFRIPDTQIFWNNFCFLK